MPPSRLVARVAVAAASAVAFSIVAAPTAHAAEAPIGGFLHGEVNVQQSSFDDSCPALNNSDQESVDINGAPDAVTTSIGGGTPGDGEGGSAHLTATSARSGGLLTDVLVKANIAAQAQDHLGGDDPETSELEGSHCSRFARAQADGEVTFQLITKRKVRLTVAGDLGTLTLYGGTLAQAVLADNNKEYDDILNSVVVGLGPGSYTLGFEAYTVEARAGHGQPIQTGGAESHDLHIDFKLHLWKPGQATGPAAGTGKSYVAFPASRTCSTHSIRVGVKQASLIKRFTVTAAGHTKTVYNPTSTTHVVLTGLPDAQAFTVNAVVRLKSGAILKASRPYARC
jgi:hypothetical protein